MIGRVKNKVIIVTGGALGIGAAACYLLAKEGGKIAITDINASEGQQVSKKINASGGESEFWLMDTSSEPQVKEVFEKIYQRWQRIDVLVNNAGIAGANKPTHELTEQEWDRVNKINVKGVFFCTKHVISYMQKNKAGSIINLSSIYGIISAADVPPYHASKGAVRLMAKTDALLYAKDGIRVNSIHPGYIWTPLVESLAKQSTLGIAEFRKSLDDLHPIGHIGEPNDIAYGILYLASDEAKFITGSELVIDGGYTAR